MVQPYPFFYRLLDKIDAITNYNSIFRTAFGFGLLNPLVKTKTLLHFEGI